MSSSFDREQLKSYLNILDKIQSATLVAKHQAEFRNNMDLSLQSVKEIEVLLKQIKSVCED